MRRRSQQQPFFVKAGGQVAASGRGYDTVVSMPTMLESSPALQVPSLVDEEERTKLSIKQRRPNLARKHGVVFGEKILAAASEIDDF